MEYTTVSTNGRITIPALIRKRLKLRTGMRVAFLEEGDKVLVVPIDKNYFRRFAGILGTRGKAVKSLMDDRKREREL